MRWLLLSSFILTIHILRRSESVSMHARLAPDAPIQSPTIPPTSTTISLEWYHPPAGGGTEIIGFRLTWTSEGYGGGVEEFMLPVLSTTVNGLYPATFYSFRVQAMNLHGYGNLSDAVNISSGSGVLCRNTVTILLSSYDYNKMDLKTGDDLLVWTDDVDTSADAEELPLQCSSRVLSRDKSVFEFNVSDCDPVTEVDEESVSYTYTVNRVVYEDPSLLVQRYTPTACVTFVCVYNTTYEITPELVMVPRLGKVQLQTEGSRGDFEFLFELFESLEYENVLPMNPLITIPGFVYAQIEVDADGNSFFVQVNRCWATAFTAPNGDLRYPLIDGGCPSRDSDGIVEVTRNNELSTSQFHFQSWVWTNISLDSQLIFLHCSVTICVEEDGKTCDPLDNGGCERNCFVNDEGNAMCGCNYNEALAEDRTSCLDISHFLGNQNESEEFRVKWTIYLFLAIFLLMALFFRNCLSPNGNLTKTSFALTI